MNNPYLVLRVSTDAGDDEIRRAYLEGIRNFPPEREPVRFQEIVDAYEKIRDVSRRDEHYLFERALPGRTPAETLAGFCLATPVPKPLPLEEMKAFLRACAMTTT